ELTVRPGVVGEQVEAEHVVGDHEGVEDAGLDELAEVGGGAVGGAEDAAEAAVGLLAQQEIDHAARAPDVLPPGLPGIDAGRAAQLQAVLAEPGAGVLEVALKLAEGAVALRADDDGVRRLADRPGHEVVGALVVGGGVDEVDAQLEAAEQRRDGLPLGHQAQLTGAKTDRGNLQSRPSQPAVVHPCPRSLRRLPGGAGWQPAVCWAGWKPALRSHTTAARWRARPAVKARARGGRLANGGENEMPSYPISSGTGR